MFIKKPTDSQISAADEKISAVFPNAQKVNGDIPVREYMIKWLSAFAPDMTYADAKAYCLPRRMYKNYLWNAFSYRKTECIEGRDAEDAAGGGLGGECFILMCETNTLYTLSDGGALTAEKTALLGNAVVFTKDFTETYVHTGVEDMGPYYKNEK